MTDRDALIRSLGTITLEAGWINTCGDLGDLLDGLLAAGWRPLSPPVRYLYDTAEYDERPFSERLEEYRQAAVAMIKAQPLISADEILKQIRRESVPAPTGDKGLPQDLT